VRCIASFTTTAYGNAEMIGRFTAVLLGLAIMFGAGLSSCVAAIANAHALECCSKDCPKPPAHRPAQCCAVDRATQDGEVAPAMPLTSPDSLTFAIALAPASTIFAAAAPSRFPLHLAGWSPPPRYIQNTLCLLQL
jgi:hypothetical protein